MSIVIENFQPLVCKMLPEIKDL